MGEGNSKDHVSWAIIDLSGYEHQDVCTYTLLQSVHIFPMHMKYMNPKSCWAILVDTGGTPRQSDMIRSGQEKFLLESSEEYGYDQDNLKHDIMTISRMCASPGLKGMLLLTIGSMRMMLMFNTHH